jgi:small subunit ribosomal protein S15
MATITKEKTLEVVTSMGANAKDSGNVRVQVGILTERIRTLTEHMKIHRKDYHSLRGLSAMVSQRKRLMKYYATKDLNGYRELVKELGLRR